MSFLILVLLCLKPVGVGIAGISTVDASSGSLKENEFWFPTGCTLTEPASPPDDGGGGGGGCNGGGTGG